MPVPPPDPRPVPGPGPAPVPGHGLRGGVPGGGCEEPWWEPPGHEPSDAELAGAWPDPFAGPPDWQTWRSWRDQADTEPGDEDQWPDGEAAAVACFAEGGPAEAMTPGCVLAALSQDAMDAG